MDPSHSPAISLSRLPPSASPLHSGPGYVLSYTQKRPFPKPEPALGSPFPHYSPNELAPSLVPPGPMPHMGSMPLPAGNMPLPSGNLGNLVPGNLVPGNLVPGNPMRYDYPAPPKTFPFHYAPPQEATPASQQHSPHARRVHVSPGHLRRPVMMPMPENPVDFEYRADDDYYGVVPPERPASQNSEGYSRKLARTDDEPEYQLKSLAIKAAAYPLQELAVKVKMLETNDPELRADPLFDYISSSRDLRQDRHLQLFAMAWIHNSCEASHTAVVPRNRIYARYVQLCANYNLNPLTAANFGKLIRILFPNLKTRRLGMRGKSKYHYCGLKLVGDQLQGGSPMSSYSSVGGMDSPQSVNPHTPSLSESPSVQQMGTPLSNIQMQEYFQLNDLKYLPHLFTAIEMSVNNESMNQPLSLPSIYLYLPKDSDIDYDIADTLHSLYRVHCTSIFELMRFMHIEKMFSLFLPVPAISTAPVFKLLTSEQVADWVRDCDLVMYRAMLKMLTRLHLQNVPDEIMQPLKEVARDYVTKLSSVLQSKFPKPFVAMKLRLARQFSLLLRRLLRCISAGSKASKVLSNSAERNSMLTDLLQLNMHEIVMREVPCALANAETLIDILDTRLVKLFEDETPQVGSGLSKYANFLFELPNRFPKINPWLFSLLCSNLLTTCIREMSMAGSRSFGSWWVVRCWVDEYISWCFELGGFLYDEFRSHHDPTVKQEDIDHSHSANASGSLELPGDQFKNTFVDLLDGLHGDLKLYGESDWL